MKKEESIWLGRTAYQLMPDRYYRSVVNYKSDDKLVKAVRIGNRILKDWDDYIPNWKPDKNGIYQNNYFYGGNLRGIAERLGYISDLGFDMIYLTPIEESDSYHHYDVGDQMMIDPWLGTWSDFAYLCKKAKSMGIIIVVDIVFNHTGSNSFYFKNPQLFPNWYKKDSNGNQSFWWGFQDLPECACSRKEYQQFAIRVVRKYLSCGASGIRLDLGENLPKEFLLALSKVKEDYPNTIFIGEMWNLATDKEDPKIFDGQLDSIMNYPMADAILRWVRFGNDRHFSYNFGKVFNGYPKDVCNILLNNIGTHDTPMTLTMLAGKKMNENVFDGRIWDIEKLWQDGNSFDTYGFRRFELENDSLTPESYELAKKLAKIAITILYNIPGIPCLYYGTEIGTTGYKDPFCRKPYNWKKQDYELKKFVRSIGIYRKKNIDILADSDANILEINQNILIFERMTDDGEKLVIAVNRSNTSQKIDIRNNSTVFNIEFCTKGCTKWKLSPYGIIIARTC